MNYDDRLKLEIAELEKEMRNDGGDAYELLARRQMKNLPSLNERNAVRHGVLLALKSLFIDRATEKV